MTPEQERALKETLVPLIVADLMPFIQKVIEKRLHLILDECIKVHKEQSK